MWWVRWCSPLAQSARTFFLCIQTQGLAGCSVVKKPPPSAGDAGLIPSPGRSPGERNGNPLQYSCLENPMDRRAWQATQSMRSQSRMWLSNWTITTIQRQVSKATRTILFNHQKHSLSLGITNQKPDIIINSQYFLQIKYQNILRYRSYRGKKMKLPI